MTPAAKRNYLRDNPWVLESCMAIPSDYKVNGGNDGAKQSYAFFRGEVRLSHWNTSLAAAAAEAEDNFARFNK